MKKLLFLIIVSLMFTGQASAIIQWAAPEVTNPYGANWGVGANWSTGTVPSSSDKAQWGLADTAVCVVDDDQEIGQTVIGDNGPDDAEHRVEIRSGGFLYTCRNGSSWTASGYNRIGHVTVQYQGKLETGNRMGCGLVAGPAVAPPIISYLNIDGGTARINGNLQIGNVNHSGYVTVNAGTLKSDGIEWQSYATQAKSRLDIGLGTYIVDGNLSDDLTDDEPPVAAVEFPTWIANDDVTAFASLADYGLESDPDVVYDAVDDVTILTADDPLDRLPEFGTFVKDGAVTLEWINLPNPPSNTVWVDLWYGTNIDPNEVTGEYEDFAQVLFDQPVISGQLTQYGTSSASSDYYWRVDTHFSNPVLDPNLVEGFTMAFTATDDEPPTNVNAGPDMITWMDEPVQLNGTYDDDGKSAVSTKWSCGGDPNTWFTDTNALPVPIVYPRGADIYDVTDPTVTCDAVKDVELTFSVWDVLNTDPVTDTMWIYVYNDACEAARDGDGGAAQYPMDLWPDARLYY